MKALALTIVAVLAASPAWSKDTVVVAGATSRSGRAIVAELIKQGYAVRAMARNPEKARDLGAGVDVVIADVTKPETLPAAMTGAQVLLSTIGAVPRGTDVPEMIDYRGVAAMTDAAKAAGVKHIVHMTVRGAGSEDPEARLNKSFQMVLKWKGKGEEYIRSSGVPYTIIRPGGLSGCEPGKQGLKLSTGNAGTTGYVQVCLADAGKVMVAAIGNPDYYNKTITVIGDSNEPVDGWRTQVASLPKD